VLGDQTAINLALLQLVLAYSMALGLRTGSLSVAPIGFMAIGGYTAGILQTHDVLEGALATIAAVAACAAVGLVLAAPLNRVTGIYAGIATLAFVLVVQELAESLDVTGGPAGLASIPLTTEPWMLYLAAGLVIVLFGCLDHSAVGRRLLVVSHDPVLASTLSINTRRLRAVALTVSAGLAGLVGALYANLYTYISPTDFSFGLVVTVAACALLGGVSHWSGPLIGVLILIELPEIVELNPTIRDAATGIVLAVIIVVAPQGIVPALQRRLTARPRDRATARESGGPDHVAVAAKGGER
jgi:branched-chain amino acid transport system permease protein